MNLSPEVLLITYSILGVACLGVSITFLYLSGSEYATSRHDHQHEEFHQYPLFHSNANEWGDVPGKLQRKITKTQALYYFDILSADQYNDMILRGVSEGISKDMKITDAEGYKCKRKTKAQAVKGRNQYLDVHMGNLDVEKITPSADAKTLFPQLNLCTQQEWNIMKTKPNHTLAVQGFYRFWKQASDVLMPYIAAQNVLSFFESGRAKNVIFTGIENKLTSRQRNAIWEDGIYGLTNPYVFYKIASNIQNGLDLDWVNFFGLPDSETTMFLTANIYVHIQNKILSEMQSLFEKVCTTSKCKTITSLETQKQIFFYAQWAYKGYKNDKLRLLLPPGTFGYANLDSFYSSLDLVDFSDLFLMSVETKYMHYFSRHEMTEEVKKINILDIHHGDVSRDDEYAAVFLPSIMEQLFTGGMNTADPSFSHPGEQINFTHMDKVSAQMGVNSTTGYFIYRYFERFVSYVVLDNNKTEAGKEDQQIGYYLSYALPALLKREAYNLYMYVLGFSSLANSKIRGVFDCYKLAEDMLKNLKPYQQQYLQTLMCNQKGADSLSLNTLNGWINWISNMPKFISQQSSIVLIQSIHTHWNMGAQHPPPTKDDLRLTLGYASKLENIVDGSEQYIFTNITALEKRACGGLYGNYCMPFEMMYAQMNDLVVTRHFNPQTSPYYANYTAGYTSLYYWAPLLSKYLDFYSPILSTINHAFEWSHLNTTLTDEPNEDLIKALVNDAIQEPQYMALIVSGKSEDHDSFSRKNVNFRRWAVYFFREIVLPGLFIQLPPNAYSFTGVHCSPISARLNEIQYYWEGNDVTLQTSEVKLDKDMFWSVPDASGSWLFTGVNSYEKMGSYLLYDGYANMTRLAYLPVDDGFGTLQTSYQIDYPLMGAHDELLGGTWKESKYMLDTFTQLPIKVNNVSRIGLETSVAINHTTYKYKEQQTLNSEYFGWVDMTNLYHFPAFATLECAESSGKLPAGSIALRTCPKVFALIKKDQLNWDLKGDVLVPLIFVTNTLLTDNLKEFFYSPSLKPKEVHMATQYLLWFAFFIMCVGSIVLQFIPKYREYQKSKREEEPIYSRMQPDQEVSLTT